MPILNSKNTSLLRQCLPLAVFAFFIICFALHPQSPIITHQLLDTDDYTRLNEVINWLQSAQPLGAGWFDLSQPRLSPGENPVIHWSRLVDIPIASIMQPFIPVYGIMNAALVASFILPCLLFAFLLALLPTVAKPLIGNRRSILMVAMVLFAPAILQNFAPGRVDHHAYQIMIALVGVACLQRMIMCQDGWECAIGAAIALACGLWIGTEALPWVIVFVGVLALLSSIRGGYALRNAAVFGLVFPMCVGAILPFAMQPEDFSSRALSWFSTTDFIFALLSGLMLILAWVIGHKTRKAFLRFMLIVALALMAGVLFFQQVPNALAGVYGDYHLFVTETLMGNISEAQPFQQRLHLNIYDKSSYLHAVQVFLRTMYLPMLAAIVVLWNLLYGSWRARTLWFIHSAFLYPAILLTWFWQARVGWFAEAFALAPIAWLFFSLVDWIGKNYSGRSQFSLEALVFIIIAPLPVLLFPAASSDAKLYPDLLLFPAARGAPACPLIKATEFLNDTYPQSAIILSGTNEGPEILFRTNHSVLAGPYNIEGNKDTFAFFNARDDKQAAEVALRRNADLILVCRSIPWFYAGLGDHQSRFNASLSMDAQGRLRITSSKDNPTLIEKLVNNQVPAWLKQVPIPGDNNYLLFELVKQVH